jgi:hypothetical protein
MKAFTQHHYENVFRWDSIAQKKVTHSSAITGFKKIVLTLHEQSKKSPRDKYVLSLCLELLTGQRVSPTILSKMTYKLSMFPLKQNNATISQVTLRRKRLFLFLDRVLLNTSDVTALDNLPNSTQPLKHFSFYYTSPLAFRECSNLHLHFHKMGPLQVHISLNQEASAAHIVESFQLASDKK